MRYRPIPRPDPTTNVGRRGTSAPPSAPREQSMTDILDAPIASALDAAPLEIDRLGAGLGAPVHGLALATADDATAAAVRQALTDHKVLFFAGQRLDPDSQIALGNRL